MKRTATIAVWICVSSVAFTAPARPLYVPPSEAPTVDLRDTLWQGIAGPDRNIYFHSNGQLSYARGQAGFGSWRLDGCELYFEFNGKYREFRGRLEGDNIHGESWNIKGLKWQTSLRRVSAPK
ncbi:MAG: hypothetical protein FJ303_25285 [Planctomycetes bacterium]|nr:hypothetical protein [Planctomycetota bacterium]